MRLTNLADELRAEHPWLKVVEIAEVDDRIHVGDTWKRRGHEYSGSGPLNVTWHHTASGGSQIGILRFEVYKYSIPGNNSNIAPDGTVYLLAAGSTATNGSVSLLRFSRGMGGRNSDSFTIEIHNPGNGSKPYPQAQIDAAFALSNTVNRLSGNQPTDCCTHHELAPGRKTDPSPARAIEGPWVPRSVTSAGTWHHDDIRAEAARRASQPGGDWFDMATKEELAEVVDHEVNQVGHWLKGEVLDPRFADLYDQNVVTHKNIWEGENSVFGQFAKLQHSVNVLTDSVAALSAKVDALAPKA